MSKGIVKPLEWRKSEITPWCEDYHTIGGTGYTVRCADENGWKWSNGVGGHGYANFPEGAKSAAQADYESRVLSALNIDAFRARIRSETLEEVAAFCDKHQVGVNPRSGYKIDEFCAPEGVHPGMAYAEAFRAMKEPTP